MRGPLPLACGSTSKRWPFALHSGTFVPPRAEDKLSNSSAVGSAELPAAQAPSEHNRASRKR